MLGYKKGNKKLLTGQIPLHYPADRVYLDGDTTKSVQDKVVMISEDLKEINDAINELTDNTVSGYTDISEYTTSENKFIAPTDGYVNIVVGAGQNGYASIRGSNDTVDVSIGKAQGEHAVYIRKGMKVQIIGTLNGAYFIRF